jgi:carbonic anhydrase/acetyltransferase-like protein (isoleucine patch superfamily)
MKDVTIVPFNGKTPQIHETAFVAPGCRIIGDVTIGAGSSVWYNCVLRGDVNRIVIGERSNIQDGTVIHCDGDHGPEFPGSPMIIGDDVLVGHMAMLHGAVLHDRSFVGLGAIVMDGCAIESGGMIAAGGMLTPGKTILAGEMWGGRPARKMRDLTPQQQAINGFGIAHYVENAKAHAAAVSES